MPSLAELEQWMEDQLPPNLHDLPMKVTSTVQTYSAHIYSQLSNLTPTYSQIESSIESSLHNIPFVGNAVSCSPPPPPPPASMVEALMNRADGLTGSRMRTSIVGGVGIVGITCAVLTRSVWLPRQSKRGLRSPKAKNGMRQEAIIVLGADTPLGQSLCQHLSAAGFIVLASVANEQSMQAFDSLILPSSRGYIKSIILDPSGPRAEEISYFVRSVASARELRWPVTSAGDPYSRPGTEVEVAGVINALSYKSLGDWSMPTPSMQVDDITLDLNQRAITPLATIKALLPLLETTGSLSTSSFVISLTASHGDVSSEALLAGMKQLQVDQAARAREGRRVLLTTLEAQPTSLLSLLLSLLPSNVGGRAPLMASGQEETPALPAGGRTYIDTKGQPVAGPSRPRNMSKSASAGSDSKMQREAEYKAILDAVTSIVLLPGALTGLRSKYIVRLASAISPSSTLNTSQQRDLPRLEKTVLLQIVRLSLVPLSLLQNGMNRMGLWPGSWLSAWTRAGSAYSGSRNAANSRPAYGPGPGPASNTHSRSCIRPNEQVGQGTGSSSSSSSAKRTSRRPASATSASSSEAARSTERSTSGPSSTATASGPPSNNGLSSSGLLSSVPSSTFGDASEEDRFDYDDGNESPVQGSTDWASPVLSDRDSDTALGPRRHNDASSSHLDMEETTPSASRLVQGQDEVQYGFPSQASMQSNVEEAWMGPQSLADDAPAPATTAAPSLQINAGAGAMGTQSPLGQSWVALGQSSVSEPE